MRREQQSKEERIKEFERFVRMFADDGVAECPTCHTPSASLAAQVTRYKDELVSMRAALADLKTAASQQTQLEQAWDAWERRQKIREVQEQQLDVSEKDLLAVKPPAAPEEELQQAVADYEDFELAQSELQPMIQKAREEIGRLSGLLTAANERREALQQTIKEITTTAADAHMAKFRLDELRNKCSQRQVLEQQRAKLTADIEQLDSQYVTAKKQEADAIKIRKWAELSEKARDALKNAPRLVAQRNLQRLEAAINELLQIFSVNFLVRVAGDGTPTFVAEFYDGRRQVAQRLSIGQKTVLALAFRVAVNAQFAEEIGLLALDEPTASLDAPRIQALAPVLEKLRDLSTAKGLQCLLVTHAAGLSHLFESTIELEPPELRHVRPQR
jgi:DNA repair exonuclease SbcCD ATPase subunit